MYRLASSHSETLVGNLMQTSSWKCSSGFPNEIQSDKSVLWKPQPVQSPVADHNVTASSVLSERQHFIEQQLIECYTWAQRQVMPLHPIPSGSHGVKYLASCFKKIQEGNFKWQPHMKKIRNRWRGIKHLMALRLILTSISLCMLFSLGRPFLLCASSTEATLKLYRLWSLPYMFSAILISLIAEPELIIHNTRFTIQSVSSYSALELNYNLLQKEKNTFIEFF